MNVSWKKGYRAYTSPLTCYEELERIRAKEGFLNKDVVKEYARDKDNPLHYEIFDCDAEIASERYYSDRAAQVIRSIEVTRTSGPEKPTRAYEITTLNPREAAKPLKAYKTTEEILSDPIGRAELLGDAIRDIHRLKNRYYMLSELAKIFKVIDEQLFLMES